MLHARNETGIRSLTEKQNADTTFIPRNRDVVRLVQDINQFVDNKPSTLYWTHQLFQAELNNPSEQISEFTSGAQYIFGTQENNITNMVNVGHRFKSEYLQALTKKTIKHFSDSYKVNYFLSFQKLVINLERTNLWFKDRLIKRLQYLSSVSLEDAVEDIDPINIDSLSRFVDFISIAPPINYPNITLTPSNLIYVAWKGDQERLFSLCFQPDADVRFTSFQPESKNQKKMLRLSGHGSVDEILNHAKNNGILNWMAR